MSLMKNLQGKQVAGIILVVVFLMAIFTYGVREWRTSKQGYCMFGPNKAAPGNACGTETCKVEKADCCGKSAAR